MPVVSICNHKGGSGKTTTTVNVAAALGKSGHRVLVLDFDPQGFLSHTLGVGEPRPEHSSLALLDPEGRIDAVPTVSMSGFELIPASQMLTRAQRTLTKPTDVFWLKETLQQGHPYDLVLVDTAAAVSVFTMNALVASDHVVIPVTPEYQPVVGAEQTWQTAKLVREKLNPSLAEPVFLLTQVDGRKRDHGAYARYLHDTYGSRLLRSIIRTSASLAETTRDGRTVFDGDLGSRGARDYAAASDEIAAFLYPGGAGASGEAAAVKPPQPLEAA
ncbi:MAG TPA: ParA family protein [Rhodothermales bacterium]|nr:ParA family protein [Rhodothermales bacterium]